MYGSTVADAEGRLRISDLLSPEKDLRSVDWRPLRPGGSVRGWTLRATLNSEHESLGLRSTHGHRRFEIDVDCGYCSMCLTEAIRRNFDQRAQKPSSERLKILPRGIFILRDKTYIVTSFNSRRHVAFHGLAMICAWDLCRPTNRHVHRPPRGNVPTRANLLGERLGSPLRPNREASGHPAWASLQRGGDTLVWNIDQLDNGARAYAAHGHIQQWDLWLMQLS